MRIPGKTAVALAVLLGCSGARRGVRDFGERPRRDDADAAAAPAATTTVSSVSTSPPTSAGTKPRVLAKAYASAIATTPSTVYFSDAEDDTIFALSKKDAKEPVRVAQRAPVSGGLAVDASSLTWIATPGDVVFRMPLAGGTTPTVLREREIFTDVAAYGGDVFLVGAEKGGGALMRITGATAARLASFDAVPRSVLVDASSVFVVTTTKVLRTTKQRGEVVTLATGTGFGAAAMDDVCLYVTTTRGSSRAILRVPKYGAATTVASTIDGVRDAPIAVRGGEIFFFDDSRPALRALRLDSNAARIVSEDPRFERVTALAVDDDGAFVATGEASSGTVVEIPLR